MCFQHLTRATNNLRVCVFHKIQTLRALFKKIKVFVSEIPFFRTALISNGKTSTIIINKIGSRLKVLDLGSGCGSVGRAVATDSRGPWLESSHWQKFILYIYCQLN